MGWSPEQRSARRARGGQVDMFDQHVLAFHPWPGEEGDVRVLSDRFLATRRAHDCVHCGEAIPAGTRVRARSEVDRGNDLAMTFYFCTACCSAMETAVSTGDPDPYFSRMRPSEGLPIQDGSPSAIVRRPGRSATSAGGPQ